MLVLDNSDNTRENDTLPIDDEEVVINLRFQTEKKTLAKGLIVTGLVIIFLGYVTVMGVSAIIRHRKTPNTDPKYKL